MDELLERVLQWLDVDLIDALEMLRVCVDEIRLGDQTRQD